MPCTPRVYWPPVWFYRVFTTNDLREQGKVPMTDVVITLVTLLTFILFNYQLLILFIGHIFINYISDFNLNCKQYTAGLRLGEGDMWAVTPTHVMYSNKVLLQQVYCYIYCTWSVTLRLWESFVLLWPNISSQIGQNIRIFIRFSRDLLTRFLPEKIQHIGFCVHTLLYITQANKFNTHKKTWSTNIKYICVGNTHTYACIE